MHGGKEGGVRGLTEKVKKTEERKECQDRKKQCEEQREGGNDSGYLENCLKGKSELFRRALSHCLPKSKRLKTKQLNQIHAPCRRHRRGASAACRAFE